MSDEELQKFMCWALQKYAMSYCLDHMDEVFKDYVEETGYGRKENYDSNC